MYDNYHIKTMIKITKNTQIIYFMVFTKNKISSKLKLNRYLISKRFNL